MDKRGCLIGWLMAITLCSFAQDIRPDAIPRLVKELKTAASDSTHCRLMLDLALAYVYKPGDLASDLDSALLLAGHEIVCGTTGCRHLLYQQ